MRRWLVRRGGVWVCGWCLGALWAGCGAESASASDGATNDQGVGEAWADSLARSGDAGGDGVLAARSDLNLTARIPVEGLTLYVNMGDSIAAGYGIGRGLSYPELLVANDDESYPKFAGYDFEARVGAGKVTLASVARVGATSAELSGQLARAPDNPQGETLVTVSVGGNDLLNDFQALVAADSTGVEKITDTILDNLRQVKAHFMNTERYGGRVTIVVLNVYDPTDGLGSLPPEVQVNQYCGLLKTFGKAIGPRLLANFAHYNSALAAFAAEEGLILADMHTVFLGHGFHYDDSSAQYYDAEDPALWFMSDCIHPTYEGHDAVRALLWATLVGDTPH